MRRRTSRVFSLKKLFAIPLLVSLPLAFWNYQTRHFPAERAAMDRFPRGSSFGYSGIGRRLRMPDQLRRIGSVDLSRSQLTDSQLVELIPQLRAFKRLAEIDLSSTKVTDSSVRALCDLPQLRHINLQNVRVSGEIVRMLKRHCPNAVVLADKPAAMKR